MLTAIATDPDLARNNSLTSALQSVPVIRKVSPRPRRVIAGGVTSDGVSESKGQIVSLVVGGSADVYTATYAPSLTVRVAKTPQQLKQLMDPLGTIETKLAAFRRLPKNWDSYNGVPTSGKAVRAARQLVRSIRNDSRYSRKADRLRPLCVAPLGYGGVQLEWRGPGGEVEIEIEEDGTFGLLLTPSVGEAEEQSAVRPGYAVKAIWRVIEG